MSNEDAIRKAVSDALSSGVGVLSISHVPIEDWQNDMRQERDAAIARAEAAEAQVERLEDALTRIAQWADAYPLDVFPEPNLVQARALLEAGGMTLDSISASAMRYCLNGTGRIARAALAGKEPADG